MSDKLVFFHEYCHLCKNDDLDEGDDPCYECLQNPANTDSHKPVRFDPKDNRKGGNA